MRISDWSSDVCSSDLLEEVDLSRLDLSGWRFERCNLRHADLSGAVLEGVAWQGCRGAFANFTGATLAESSFHASDFNNAAFRRAKQIGRASCRERVCQYV